MKGGDRTLSCGVVCLVLDTVLPQNPEGYTPEKTISEKGPTVVGVATRRFRTKANFGGHDTEGSLEGPSFLCLTKANIRM